VAGLNAAEQAALSRGLHDSNAKCAAALSELDVARERSERVAKEVRINAHCYDHFLCVDCVQWRVVPFTYMHVGGRVMCLPYTSMSLHTVCISGGAASTGTRGLGPAAGGTAEEH